MKEMDSSLGKAQRINVAKSSENIEKEIDDLKTVQRLERFESSTTNGTNKTIVSLTKLILKVYLMNSTKHLKEPKI